MSPTDSKYFLTQKISIKKEPKKKQAGAVFLYQNVISPILNTECRWIPSDSAYGLEIERKCGASAAIIKTLARYLSEFDANKISSGIVNENNRAHFYHFDNDCYLF